MAHNTGLAYEASSKHHVILHARAAADDKIIRNDAFSDMDRCGGIGVDGTIPETAGPLYDAPISYLHILQAAGILDGDIVPHRPHVGLHVPARTPSQTPEPSGDNPALEPGPRPPSECRTSPDKFPFQP